MSKLTQDMNQWLDLITGSKGPNSDGFLETEHAYIFYTSSDVIGQIPHNLKDLKQYNKKIIFPVLMQQSFLWNPLNHFITCCYDPKDESLTIIGDSQTLNLFAYILPSIKALSGHCGNKTAPQIMLSLRENDELNHIVWTKIIIEALANGHPIQGIKQCVFSKIKKNIKSENTHTIENTVPNPPPLIPENPEQIKTMNALMAELSQRGDVIQKRIDKGEWFQNHDKNKEKIKIIRQLKDLAAEKKTTDFLSYLGTHKAKLTESTSTLFSFFRAKVTTAEILEKYRMDLTPQ